MSANPKKRERWPIPRTTRHVWIMGEQRFIVPLQGYVIAWRRYQYQWSAFVAYVDETDDDKPVVQKWIPATKLVPVRSIPDDLMKNPLTAEVWRRATRRPER